MDNLGTVFSVYINLDDIDNSGLWEVPIKKKISCSYGVDHEIDYVLSRAVYTRDAYPCGGFTQVIHSYRLDSAYHEGNIWAYVTRDREKANVAYMQYLNDAKEELDKRIEKLQKNMHKIIRKIQEK